MKRDKSECWQDVDSIIKIRKSLNTVIGCKVVVGVAGAPPSKDYIQRFILYDG